MKIDSSSRVARVSLLVCAALWCVVPAAARRQQQQQQSQPASSRPEARQDEDVLRVSTSLVQTDVTVLDKQGRFAEGLRREDFELKVDGRPQPLVFFERVSAGGAEEARRIAAARGETATAVAPASASARGRSVIFLVDDVHTSPQGILRARQLINKIIDEELPPDTQALVASPSGRVGFLQQFTNEKAVLRAAVARLSSDGRGALDAERPAMSFYQAIQIDRGDRDMLQYFISQTAYQASPGGMPGEVARVMVTNRARRIRRQAALLSAGVLGSVESAAAAPAPSQGRRLLYFISEGFTLDSQEGDAQRRFQRVVDAAARSGTVIYTLDTRGLSVGMHDASSSVGADIMSESSTGARGFAGYSPTAELSATQDVLRSLAADTGGRALLNTNALEAALARTLAETADYYLLAWRPEGVEAEAGGAPRFRKIEVSVRNRPDLKARVRRGVFAGRPPAAGAPEKREAAAVVADASKPAASALNSELNAAAPARALPVELYAVHASDAPGESTLTAFVQVDGGRLEYFTDANGRRVAEVETAFVVLDDRGKSVHSTGRRLTLDGGGAGATPSSSGARVALLTSFNVPALAPGVYQVRVAARDQRGGAVGGARQWAEVPDLKSRRLALGGLVLAERRAAVAAGATGNSVAAGSESTATPRPSASRVFARASKMLVELHIYNAAAGAGSGAAGPDLEMSLRVLDRGREVLAAPPHKVSTAGASDPARIRYAAEIPLRALAPGAYLLEVNVTDRNARTTAARQLAFAVE